MTRIIISLKGFEKRFNQKFGWLFVNGRKQAKWYNSLEDNAIQKNSK